MPIPVSVHRERDDLPASSSAGTSKSTSSAAGAIRSVTAPASVNFTALDSRLRRICCSRWASVMIVGGRSSGRLDPRSQALLLGLRARTPARRSRALGERGPRRRRRPSGPPRSWTGRGCRRSARSRSEPALWIVRANSICLRGQVLRPELSASSRDSSSSELSGVRSSWLMLARNSDLYCATPGRAAAPSPPGRGRASSISRFLVSMLPFCSDSSSAFSSSSALVRCSSADCSCSSCASRWRLGQQLLGTPVGLDGVERDADGRDEPARGTSGAARRTAVTTGELDHAEHSPSKSTGQHDQIGRRRRRPDARADLR